MSVLVKTAVDIYKSFLRALEQEGTHEYTPEDFNTLFNESMILWIKSKLPTHEFVQKRIDDLMAIKTVTDGTIQEVIPSDSSNVFKVPVYGAETINSVLYKSYLHGLTVNIKKADDSSWTPAFILRSDKRGVMQRNPYRNKTIYFEYYENKIVIVPNNGITYEKLRLEYIRYPREYFFDEDSPEDNNENTAHTAGSGSVTTEFSPEQNIEIISIAVRKTLGKEGDQKYEIAMTENNIDNN